MLERQPNADGNFCYLTNLKGKASVLFVCFPSIIYDCLEPKLNNTITSLR